MRILSCGHGHYDKGHCGIPGCPNDYFACADCCPAGQRLGFAERAHDIWDSTFRARRTP